MQSELDIGTQKIDLARFVTFEPATFEQRYKVMGGHKEGDMVGVIRLTHSGGYEVLLRDDKGKVTSHNPHALFPIPARTAEKGGAQ